MKFSIVIPVYNGALYLRECLDSVLAQTYRDWEAICVDDGSTDGGEKLLDEYRRKDGRFRVIHQKNLGVSLARNTGIRMVEGDYFMFVDADDTIAPESLEKFGAYINKHQLDGLCIDNVGKELVPLGQNIQDRAGFLCGRYPANGCVAFKVYSREKFGHLRFLEGMRYREDLCFWSDALRIDARWGSAQYKYYNYRKHPRSASSRISTVDFKDLFICHIHVLESLKADKLNTAENVKAYVSHLGRGVRGAAEFALTKWQLLTKIDRREVVRLMTQTRKLAGYNPYDFYANLALAMRWMPGGVRLVVLCHKALKRLGISK